MPYRFPDDATPMLEQTLQSSDLSAVIQKLLLDLREETSVVGCMDNGEKFDAIKVRGALFALITARLEDAHEIAVKGQSAEADHELISQLASDLEAYLEEIQTLLNASTIVTKLTLAES
ncbi:MAG: hypothetical protein GW822_14865 [Sphingomonadales bacterium]|nr:hypothetical protein [Sphingomonadales bacterium]PIX66961.1 MAG: hypothetical protein COZ43_03975 [Sphingomonadales bacterium CG_4_10_14_3_um_filter_58_15]